jgi:hypothetical protein
LAKTAIRLGGYYILPTTTANRLGGGGYITAFNLGFWPVLDRVFGPFGSVFVTFGLILNQKSKTNPKIPIQIQIQNLNITTKT